MEGREVESYVKQLEIVGKWQDWEQESADPESSVVVFLGNRRYPATMILEDERDIYDKKKIQKIPTLQLQQEVLKLSKEKLKQFRSLVKTIKRRKPVWIAKMERGKRP